MKVRNFLLIEQIGSGSFSTVYKAVDVDDRSKVYAIKSMRDIPQNEEKAIRKEITILEDIQKRNIKNVVNYVTEFNHNGKWYIVFEYCGKGDLQNFLKKQGRLPEIFCKNLASSVIEALSQLHEKNIAHRDLKLSNILINDQYDFKIADFGMAKAQEGGIMQSYCGTPYAMAPEVLKRESYDTKCDTWSLGIMIYQMVYGKLPFDGRKNGGGILGLTAAVLQEQPQYNPSVKVSQDCIGFIKLCLKKNPEERPSMQQLANHPWLSVGVGSLIRKDLLKQSFEGSNTETETTKRTKQVLNQAMQAHITKLIKNYRLNGKEIASFMAIFDKYYKDQAKIKQIIILMIAKIIKELVDKPILIHIEKDKTLTIKLTKIDSFKTHIMNLQGVLKQILQKIGAGIKPDSDKNLQRDIITFVVNKAEACLAFDENFPDKISLIQYLSKLPINIPGPSSIKIKWGFNQINPKSELKFNEYIKTLTEEIAYKFINEPCNNEGGQKNWIIEHDFERTRREGGEIQLGEFISKVIDINCQGCQ